MEQGHKHWDGHRELDGSAPRLSEVWADHTYTNVEFWQLYLTVLWDAAPSMNDIAARYASEHGRC